MRNALLRDWLRTQALSPPHGPGGRAACREFALQHLINIIDRLPRHRQDRRVIPATLLMIKTSGCRSTGCASVMAGSGVEERAASVVNAVGKRLAPKPTFSANREFCLQAVALHPGCDGLETMRAHLAATGMAGRCDAPHVVDGDTAMKVPVAIRARCRVLERASPVAAEQLTPWAP